MTFLELPFLLVTFLAVFVVPGYFCALLAGCHAKAMRLETLAVSGLLGVACVTVATYYVSLVVGFGRLAVVLSAAIVAAVPLALGARRKVALHQESGWCSDRLSLSRRQHLLLWLAIAGMAATVWFSQSIITIADRTYFPLNSRDFFVRTIVTDGILESGLPPINNFASIGVQPPLSCNYFLNLTCASLAVLTHAPSVLTWPFMGVISGVLFILALLVTGRAWLGSTRPALLFVALVFCCGFDLVLILAKSLVVPLICGQHISFGLWDSCVDFWTNALDVPCLAYYLVWAPHHLMAVALSLLVIRFVEGNSARKMSQYVLWGIVLAHIVGMSLPIGVVLGVGLSGLGVWHALRRQWPPLVPLIGMGILAAVLAVPWAYMQVMQSSASTMRFALPEYNLWGGAIFHEVFGPGRITHVLDVMVHLLLEYGCLLFLGPLGIMFVLKERHHALHGGVLLMVGVVSLLMALLTRTPVESFGRSAIILCSLVLGLGSASWICRAPGGRGISKLAMAALALVLVLQFSGSAYELARGAGARFVPFSVMGSRHKRARRDFQVMNVARQIDRVIQKPSRIQVMPPWNNLDNESASCHISVFSRKATVMYVADGALYYGMNRHDMERYLVSLLAIYGGDTSRLAQSLAAYDPASLMDAPWWYYILLVRRSFEGVEALSQEALLRFVHDYRIDYLLIEPEDRILAQASAGLQASGVAEIIRLDYGYMLLKVAGRPAN